MCKSTSPQDCPQVHPPTHQTAHKSTQSAGSDNDGWWEKACYWWCWRWSCHHGIWGLFWSDVCFKHKVVNDLGVGQEFDLWAHWTYGRMFAFLMLLLQLKIALVRLNLREDIIRIFHHLFQFSTEVRGSQPITSVFLKPKRLKNALNSTKKYWSSGGRGGLIHFSTKSE